MTRALLPQAFWFRLAVTVPRIDAMPRTGRDAGARFARLVGSA